MVSVGQSREPDRSWWELLHQLRARLRMLSSASSFDWALARFMLQDKANASIKLLDFPPFDSTGFLRDFVPTVTNTATLGFLTATKEVQVVNVSDKLTEGLERCVRQRPPASGPSVHSEPRLLLGLGAGLVALKDRPEWSGWFSMRFESLAGKDEPSKSILGAYGETLLGDGSAWKTLEKILLKAEPNDSFEAVFVLWALNLDPSRFSDESREGLQRLRQRSLEALPFLEIEKLDALGCALSLSVVSQLLQGSIQDLQQTAMGQLLGILAGLPRALAKEGEEPQDEYDIQRVLWTMLAGVYPDVQDEQWLTQFGVYQPRADLAIDSLKTIIEAKFIKHPNEFRKIQDELTSDATSYTKLPQRFDKVVAVIYDDTSSQHEYSQLREALESVPGVAKVLVFSKVKPRPSKRRRSYRAPRAFPGTKRKKQRPRD